MPIDINLTYRANLVSPLTWAQGDANFKTLADNDVFLNDAVEVAQATADSAVANANGRQPVNAKLTAIAAQVWAANQMLYLTGANSLETRPVNEYGIGLLNYDSAVSFKTALSLQNVNNTSDANKPVSTATQTAIDSVISNTATDLSDLESEIQTKLDLKMNSSQRGVANGVASLGADTKVPAAQLPLGTANGAASLGADGKLPVSQLPPLAVNEVFTVASQSAMLALTAERGDVAVRSDQTGLAYILASDDPTVLANWKPLDQALSVSLAALNTLTPAADRIPIFTGAATAALQIVTTLGKSLMAIADAAAARLAIMAAKSGANSDITSLDSLTTPLSVSQGGTNGNTQETARSGLGLKSAAIVDVTGTVADGAIFESGSNSNGEYVMFQDGTIIQTRSIALGTATVSTASGACFVTSSAVTARAFPKTMTDVHYWDIRIFASNAQCWATCAADATSTAWPAFYIHSTTSGTPTVTAKLYAKGRWKA